jgi:asparagine synthase (glutamine-hydrolysing)
VSDRPLGVYLSGGLDSSAVLAAMAKQHGGGIDTFSIGFLLGEGEEPAKFNADFELARATAKHFGAHHHEVFISSSDAVEFFEKTAYQLDEPIANPTAIVQLKLAEFAKEKVDVVLSGDGGDELFGGYERYRLSRAASLYQRFVPAPFRNVLAVHDTFRKLNIPPGIERYAHFLFLKDREINGILAPEFVNDETEQLFDGRYFVNVQGSDFETHFMAADRDAWLVDESLTRSDKMSMASGLENRVPLLDLELVALADTLPLSCKVTPLQTKILLKEAFRDELPGDLFRQPKRGWFSPAAKWLRQERFSTFAREVLSPYFYPETAQLFRWDGVSRMLEDHIEKRHYNLTPLWMLMTFQLWARAYQVKVN